MESQNMDVGASIPELFGQLITGKSIDGEMLIVFAVIDLETKLREQIKQITKVSFKILLE
jgi:hypothetical protein